MGAMAFQITSLSIVYPTVCSGADQRKHQSSASLAFVRGIHRWPVNSPHKWPVTRKMFPFDDVIMRPGAHDARLCSNPGHARERPPFSVDSKSHLYTCAQSKLNKIYIWGDSFRITHEEGHLFPSDSNNPCVCTPPKVNIKYACVCIKIWYHRNSLSLMPIS